MLYPTCFPSFTVRSLPARFRALFLALRPSGSALKRTCSVLLGLCAVLGASEPALAYRAPVGAVFTLNTSAYNSVPGQTDSTPFVTATGTRTRPGVLAMSRDMLRSGLPHGTRLRAVSQSGCGLNVVGRTFIVEDTMGPGRTRAADLWMYTRDQARTFGRCRVRFQII